MYMHIIPILGITHMIKGAPPNFLSVICHAALWGRGMGWVWVWVGVVVVILLSYCVLNKIMSVCQHNWMLAIVRLMNIDMCRLNVRGGKWPPKGSALAEKTHSRGYIS